MDIASLGIKIQTQGAKEAAADLDKLQTSATRAEASVKKIAPSARTSSEALALFNKIDPAAGKLQKLDELEASLTRLSKTGKVSATDFTAMSAKLAESRGKIIAEGAAINEASTLVQKFTSNTRLMSEASTIASDVVSGQFGRIRRSAAAMANASGVFRLAFTGTGAVVLGLAASVGVLVAAFKEAEDEQAAFANAIIATGNNAGLTTEKLQAMADRIDRTTTATASGASKALAQVAGTGKFTADQIELVSKAAVNMEAATGKAADKTVEDFARLKDAPVDYILKLNEAGEINHFLTRSVIDQIRQLQEQGREADAAAVAIKAYADAINTRAPEMEKNIGAITLLFLDLKRGAAEGFDEVVKGFRNSEVAAASAKQTFLAALSALPLVQAGARGLVNILGAQQRALNAPRFNPSVGKTFQNVVGTSDTTVDSDTVRAQIEFDKEGLRYATERQRMEADIKQAKADGLRAGKSELEIEQRIAAIRASYARKGPKPPNLEPAENRAALQQYEDELKREQGAITNQTQLLEANYAARNISAEKYYDEQRRLAKESTDDQVKALTGEIAVLQARNVNGKQSIDNARMLAEKEAELAKARADGATKAQVLDIQEAALLRQRQQANQAYKDALDQNTNALKADFDSQVLRIGMGEREFEIQSRINELYREEAKELLNLARARDANELSPDAYAERVAQLKVATEEEVQVVRDGYRRMSEAQADWKNGAIKAFQDYGDAANDVAGQVYGIFSDAFRGLEDTLVDFFTKGKADWKGFLDGIAAEITRFVVRQQLSKLYAKFVPGGDKGNTDQAAALSGAAGQLAASAGPLLGAAAALSASAAALAAAGGVSGGGGGGWMGALASIFSSDSSSTGGYGSWDGAIAAVFGGGRAYGGSVSAGKIYEVGEGNQPEILQMHGRSYLLPGNQGNVTPIAAARSGGTTVNQTLVLQGRPDSRTPDQYAQAAARGQNRVSSRNR